MAVSAQGHSNGVEQAAQRTTDDLRRHYQAGEYSAVIQAFEGGEGEKETPSQPQELLYLGLSFLKTGARAKAIDVFRRYRTEFPGSEGEREVSQYLTLLLQEEARHAAKAVLAEEAQRGAQDLNAVAVFPFAYTGEPQYRPISKGLAAMIITDLSAAQSFHVVERIRLQALIDELALAQTVLVASESAPRAGRLLSAGRLLTGALFHDPEGESLRLDAVITQTESGAQTTLPENSGKLQEFYRLEKILVFKILCGTGYCPEGLDDPRRSAVEKIHTQNFKAFLHYSEGLEQMDRGDYRAARQAFSRAVEEDPGFELARTSLLETPLFPMDLTAVSIATERLAEENQEASEPLPVPEGAPRAKAPASKQPTPQGKETDNVEQKEEPIPLAEETANVEQKEEPILLETETANLEEREKPVLLDPLIPGDPFLQDQALIIVPLEILVPPESVSFETAPPPEIVLIQIEMKF